MNELTKITECSTSTLAALAVDHAQLGVWELMLSSGEWRCSPRCKELLGVGDNERPIDALSGEDRRRFTVAIARAIRQGEYYVELKVHERWFAAIGRVVRDPHGPASIVGTLQDITGHRVALEVCFGEIGLELAKPLAIMRVGVHRLRCGASPVEVLAGMDDMIAQMQRMVSELIHFSRSQPSVIEHVVSQTVARERPFVAKRRRLVG
ncbi:MAG: Sensor histidine kinase [Myxococcales bacterium]|nr:Sensor histidine kinase [Myxococcales bacterium]